MIIVLFIAYILIVHGPEPAFAFALSWTLLSLILFRPDHANPFMEEVRENHPRNRKW